MNYKSRSIGLFPLFILALVLLLSIDILGIDLNENYSNNLPRVQVLNSFAFDDEVEWTSITDIGMLLIGVGGSLHILDLLTCEESCQPIDIKEFSDRSNILHVPGTNMLIARAVKLPDLNSVKTNKGKSINNEDSRSLDLPFLRSILDLAEMRGLKVGDECSIAINELTGKPIWVGDVIPFSGIIYPSYDHNIIVIQDKQYFDEDEQCFWHELAALDLSTGDLLWTRSMFAKCEYRGHPYKSVKEYKGATYKTFNPNFPRVREYFDPNLITVRDGLLEICGADVALLDIRTGKALWCIDRQEHCDRGGLILPSRDRVATYSSDILKILKVPPPPDKYEKGRSYPGAIDFDIITEVSPGHTFMLEPIGTDKLLVMEETGKKKYMYDIKTGSLIWQMAGEKGPLSISPINNKGIQIHDNRLIVINLENGEFLEDAEVPELKVKNDSREIAWVSDDVVEITSFKDDKIVDVCRYDISKDDFIWHIKKEQIPKQALFKKTSKEKWAIFGDALMGLGEFTAGTVGAYYSQRYHDALSFEYSRKLYDSGLDYIFEAIEEGFTGKKGNAYLTIQNNDIAALRFYERLERFKTKRNQIYFISGENGSYRFSLVDKFDGAIKEIAKYSQVEVNSIQLDILYDKAIALENSAKTLRILGLPGYDEIPEDFRSFVKYFTTDEPNPILSSEELKKILEIDVEKRRVELSKGTKEDCNKSRDFYEKGIRSSDKKESISYLEQARELCPRQWPIHYYLGIAYEHENHIADAIKSFNDAIILKPNYAKAHFNLGEIYGSVGEYELAEKHFKECISLTTGDTSSLYIFRLSQSRLRELTNADSLTKLRNVYKSEIEKSLSSSNFSSGQSNVSKGIGASEISALISITSALADFYGTKEDDRTVETLAKSLKLLNYLLYEEQTNKTMGASDPRLLLSIELIASILDKEDIIPGVQKDFIKYVGNGRAFSEIKSELDKYSATPGNPLRKIIGINK